MCEVYGFAFGAGWPRLRQGQFACFVVCVAPVGSGNFPPPWFAPSGRGSGAYSLKRHRTVAIGRDVGEEAVALPSGLCMQLFVSLAFGGLAYFSVHSLSAVTPSAATSVKRQSRVGFPTPEARRVAPVSRAREVNTGWGRRARPTGEEAVAKTRVGYSTPEAQRVALVVKVSIRWGGVCG